MVAIINPSNGPGKNQDHDYSKNIPKLQAVGIKPIGYVATNWANKTTDDVEEEIDAWKNMYHVEGIFFDEMSTSPGNELYYSRLDAYAKSKAGFDLTVGNPGTQTIPSYVGTVDNLVIHEDDFLPSLEALDGWHAAYDRDNFSYLAYSQYKLDASYVGASSNHVGFIYITNDGGYCFGKEADPWDTVSPHIEDLAQALDVPSVQIRVESRDPIGDLIPVDNNIKISANNVTVRIGSGTLHYNAIKNVHYFVTASDFGRFTFDHWENLDANRTRMIIPAQNATLVAFYRH